jgi:DNA transformation protein and related proteins
MAKHNEFVEYLVEQLQPWGVVSPKSMFGGVALYRDDLIFGMVDNDIFYLKVDDINRSTFEEADLPAFTYVRKGKTMAMAYHQAPESALEDPDELIEWAQLGFDAAVRAPKKKKKAKKAS